MKKPLSFAFFGSSLLSAYWNGAATYYRGIMRALHERGHASTFYEPDAFGRQAHRDLAEPEWASVVVYGTENAGPVLESVNRARDATVVVKASGVGVFDELLEEAVLELPSRALKIFWDVDAPATLDALERDEAHTLRPLIPRYDLVLTYGGGEPVVRRYRGLGARECIPIYNALDPSTHFPVAPDEAFTADVAFLGNRLPDRERRVDEFFFRAANLLSRRRFILGGSGWGSKPLPPNVRRLGHVFTRDHNAFNSTVLSVLNVTRESMASNGYSPPTRVFEAAGAAACVITDRWTGIDDFLEPGREVLVAADGDELAGYVAELTPARAARIGAAARRRMLAEHTYTHRAAQLESILAAHL